jgi:DNA-directed RNA polymerase subunit RPC12/RpoP
MRCRDCGVRGALLGEDRDWTPLNDDAASRRVYECRHCGHRQRRRRRTH